MQLSEVKLYAAAGAPPLVVSAASNKGGASPPNQPASAAVDGDTSTKWFDSSMVTANATTLVIELAAASPLREFELFTANDNIKRDPTAWRLERRRPDGDWELMSEASGVVPPDARKASYGRMQASSSAPSSPTPSPPPSASPPIVTCASLVSMEDLDAQPLSLIHI